MPLTASGLAAAITAAQGPASPSPAVQSDANMALATAIVDYITANAIITVTIEAGSIVTNGSPTTQTGPAAPLPVVGTIS